ARRRWSRSPQTGGRPRPSTSTVRRATLGARPAGGTYETSSHPLGLGRPLHPRKVNFLFCSIKLAPSNDHYDTIKTYMYFGSIDTPSKEGLCISMKIAYARTSQDSQDMSRQLKQLREV